MSQLLGLQLPRPMEAEGRKPSGSSVPNDKPDGLRRSAITPKLSLEKSLVSVLTRSPANNSDTHFSFDAERKGL
jgi:hypothetical protein